MKTEIINANEKCSFCKEVVVSPKVIFCSNCGYPENGTDKERTRFFAKRTIEKHERIDARKQIKSARNTLYTLCGIMLVFGVIIFFGNNSVLELGIHLFFSFLYLTLAFWSEKKPFEALLIALLLYVTLLVIGFIDNPRSIFSGIIWKVIIISFLGKGMYSAFIFRQNIQEKTNTSNND